MIAIDTNVLIYASAQADQRRQKIAVDLIPTGPIRTRSSRPAAVKSGT
jgi:predicted nucleic acid-binding protein